MLSIRIFRDTFPRCGAPSPYFPGIGGNAPAADGSQLDPRLKPNHSDEFTLSVQRTLGSKMLIEAGYIGRRIRNEFQEINLDAVPWMTTLNNQSFAQAYANVYNQICPGSGPVCGAGASAASIAAAAAAVTPQPFFEAMMGGPGSAFCTGSPSCTAAVVKAQAGNIATTKAYSTWLGLANNSSSILGRTLLAQGGPDNRSPARSTISTRSATAISTPRSFPSRPETGTA